MKVLIDESREESRGYETHTESVMMTAMEKMLGKSFSKTSQVSQQFVIFHSFNTQYANVRWLLLKIPPAKPLLIIISGPSGVGKDAVINRLQSVKGDMHFVVTATSRPKREGEVEGKDYIFLDREQFEDMIQRGDLLEHAVVYGDYKGIPKQQVRKALAKGTDVVLRLDVQGAATIRKLIPNSISIFLVAENERALTRRLLARKTEPLDKALVRVETAQKETQRIEEFDYGKNCVTILPVFLVVNVLIASF